MSKCEHRWVTLCPPHKEVDVEVRQFRCDMPDCHATKTEREWLNVEYIPLERIPITATVTRIDENGASA